MLDIYASPAEEYASDRSGTPAPGRTPQPNPRRRPAATGLYDPRFEHDACGVGFVAHIKGVRSRLIVESARDILMRMTHRGAVGSEKNSGDGAGILTTLPQDFLERVTREMGIDLPPRGLYSAGIVFLPRDDEHRRECIEAVGRIVEEEGQNLLGWREVPRDNSMIGPSALASEPAMRQLIVGAGDGYSSDAFERKLYVIRKRATHQLRASAFDPDEAFYVCSLSVRVIVYKGMLMPEQLFDYFADLNAPDFTSHLAMVHSRFSTNTFPSWDRAQPARFMSHNGEINTLRGNVNKMAAREGTLSSPWFGDDLRKVFPIIEPDQSDSGTFDNVLEMLLLSGRELPEAIMMMVPEAWEGHRHMPDIGSAMYEFMSTQMEPWDGPASIVFTDGRVIGAVLDRNGLRPSRYYVTDDDIVVMASEAGVLDIPPEKVVSKDRLKPGRMFLVDFKEGRIVDDAELKNGIAARYPYRKWLDEQRITLSDLSAPKRVDGRDDATLIPRLRMFGYTVEHLELILRPMAEQAKEPLGSMGNDTPLACLSDQPRLLYDYFKQLFAQVTNPPIDSIREDLIMSLSSYIGPEQNLLSVSEAHAHRLQLSQPLLTNRELAQLKELGEHDHRGWRSRVVDITYPFETGEEGMRHALRRISDEVESAITDGYSIAILSDRLAGPDRVALSALLAMGAVHHHLVRNHKRTQIGIIVESGEPREVHHFCTLVAYGADAVNPYLAYEAIWSLRDSGDIDSGFSDDEVVTRYHEAVAYGMRKVFGKMGISTLESYKGAQIFESVGLADEVIDLCFAGTASRIQGVGFRLLAEEADRRHLLGYPAVDNGDHQLPNPGDYHWRFDGERHMWDPESIALLQQATIFNDPRRYREFADRQNRRSREQSTLRGLLRFKEGTPIPIDEVEPAVNIVRRFATGAMSFGSISQEAHETLAIAMNRIGGKSNTGEGGELPERYHPGPDGESKRSAIKQVASGRFGVTIDYLTNADELQIKMAQGAKPGEGGELPGHKVFDIIAKTRFSTPGVGLISPPPHHDIYSIEDLAQLIFDLKNANPDARISVKLVSEVGVGTVAAGVAKAHADHILISGHDGGTGASPLTGIKHAGLPWELGLAEAHQTLVMNDLRSRVVLQTDGQIKTGRDIAIAAMLGAEECGFATSALITVGCIMMRKCQNNTCPVGVATQDPTLRAKFTGKPEHVVNFMMFIAEDLRSIMAELGFRTYDEMVGRVDMLEPDEGARNWKAGQIDLSAVLRPPVAKTPGPVICCVGQDHGIDDVLDRDLIRLAAPALERKEPVRIDLPIANTDRTTGTMLSHEIAKRYGLAGLPDDTIHVSFTGSAGQSFGAWLARGVTLELEGDANDYVGKGLSGGTLIAYPPRSSRFKAEENIIIGNVALYGAIEGHGFFRGTAAERFCVRNSGARVVIEGVGDHACEYMTGGRAVILGPTGRNFGAGMSGGIAYVLDPIGDFQTRINPGMIEIGRIDDDEEQAEVRELIRLHHLYTASEVAARVLDDWDRVVLRFHRVISPAYRKVLEMQRDQQREVVHG
ncbi:MAG: glutamate synthase large subunit [Spirochaetaceae bacterium]|nr:MAG: glutamate synthase large subunit [Spirochaetaceae bacterium]